MIGVIVQNSRRNSTPKKGERKWGLMAAPYTEANTDKQRV
jgi:hypothetical protein